MSMLNLQIQLLWASSRQLECGIKQNKIIGISLAFGHAWTSDYICMYSYLCNIYIYIYIYIYIIHTWICVYEFMNRKVFFPDTSGYMYVRVYE